MAKPEWGKKRTCQSCGAKYYDLQKDPATCPKCDTVFQVEAPTRGRRSRAAEAPKAIPAAAAAVVPVSEVEVEGLEDDALDDDDDEALPEDTSDLIDDDDDVSDVIIPVTKDSTDDI